MLLTLPSPALGEFPMGIGVIGDSYSDEYQFYPPHRSRARNWVEILARSRGLNFGAFSRASLGEPRNQGFAYNWARCEAETEDMIRTGQHTGLAGQVARGEVGVAVVFIGGNDFIHALNSEDPEGVVDTVLKRAVTNLDLAVETILQAVPRVQVFVATVPDILELPEFATRLRAGTLSPAVAAAYSNAIREFNRHLRWQAIVRRRVAILDLALATQLAPRPDSDSVVVAGRRLDRINPASSEGHAFLADSRHIGTLLQGELANHVIGALNARLGARIEPLSVAEILRQNPQASRVVRPRPR
jgi:hypothetical protein